MTIRLAKEHEKHHAPNPRSGAFLLGRREGRGAGAQ
jgi:hypothetical protein